MKEDSACYSYSESCWTKDVFVTQQIEKNKIIQVKFYLLTACSLGTSQNLGETSF